MKKNGSYLSYLNPVGWALVLISVGLIFIGFFTAQSGALCSVSEIPAGSQFLGMEYTVSGPSMFCSGATHGSEAAAEASKGTSVYAEKDLLVLMVMLGAVAVGSIVLFRDRSE